MIVPSNRSKAFARFDVVVVPFPYADRLAEKRRPAIVISAPSLQEEHGLVWLAMVTSAENRSWDCDVAVSDQKSAGLPSASVIRPAKVATVDAERIVHRIGKLTPKDARAVAGRILEFLSERNGGH
jgi:mRNA interferase MazF